MLVIHKSLSVVCLGILLAACGGGDSGSTSTPAPAPTPAPVAAQYGSVYTNQTTGSASIIAKASSQELANTKALELCLKASVPNTNCKIFFEFGDNLCGALYRSIGTNSASAGAVGGRINSSAIVAEAGALAACKNVGGTNCVFGFSACNGTGTPSSNSTIAIDRQPDGTNTPDSLNSGELSPAWTAEESK